MDLSWEEARRAQRCQLRDLLPFASVHVLQFAGFGGDAVPDTQVRSKLPTASAFHLSLVLAPGQEHWLHPFHAVPYSLELLASAGVAAVHSALSPVFSCSSPFFVLSKFTFP